MCVSKNKIAKGKVLSGRLKGGSNLVRGLRQQSGDEDEDGACSNSDNALVSPPQTWTARTSKEGARGLITAGVWLECCDEFPAARPQKTKQKRRRRTKKENDDDDDEERAHAVPVVCSSPPPTSTSRRRRPAQLGQRLAHLPRHDPQRPVRLQVPHLRAVVGNKRARLLVERLQARDQRLGRVVLAPHQGFSSHIVAHGRLGGRELLVVAAPARRVDQAPRDALDQNAVVDLEVQDGVEVFSFLLEEGVEGFRLLDRAGEAVLLFYLLVWLVGWL